MSKKLVCVLTVALVLALVATAFVGCNKEDKKATDYTVTLDYNYEGAPAAQTLTVDSGANILQSALTDPTREGYVFDGWYLDAAYNTPLTFENGASAIEVSDNITLYAKWVTIALKDITAQYVGGEKEVGDALQAGDIKVTATYTDGATKDVSASARLGGYDSGSAGSKTVTVTYSEGGVTKTTSVNVVVKEKQTNPNPDDPNPDDPQPKTLTAIRAEYKGGDVEVGGSVALADVEVTAIYSDNSEDAVTEGITLGQYDNTAAGNVRITVSYDGKSAIITVTFVAAPQPKQQVGIRAEYKGGDVEVGGSVALADVKVYAVYDDESEEELTEGFTLGDYDNSAAAEAVEITVTWGDFQDTIKVNFVEDGEPFVPSEETRTVYFSNNKKWEDLRVYIFNGAANAKVSEWPGEELEFVENNEFGEAVYSITFSVSYDKIIFNGAEGQTEDITLDEENNAYYVGDRKEDGTYEAIGYKRTGETPQPKTLASIKAVYNGEDIVVDGEIDIADITVTAIYDDESEEVVSEGVTLGEYDSSEVAADVEITVNYGGKSTTITVNFVAAPTPWEASEETQTIYFSNNQNDADVYAYVWVGEGVNKHEYKSWEEKEKATYEETNGYGQKVWSYTFSVSYTSIIFAFGEEQTEDVDLTAIEEGKDGMYPVEKVDDAWTVAYYKYEAPKPVMTVFVQVNGNYLTQEEAERLQTRFLATLTEEEKAQVSFQIEDANANTFKATVNDAADADVLVGGNSPLKDFTAHAEGALANAGTGHFESTNRKVVILSDTDCLALAKKMYAFVTTDYEEEQAWEESATKQTIYFTKPNDWAKVCAYVWTVDEKEVTHAEAEWGSKEMTYVADNAYGQKVYSYTFSVSYTNVIFLNGNEGNANQTVDIAISSLTEGNDQFYTATQVAEEGADKDKWQVAQTKYDAYVPALLDHITAVYSGGDVEIDGSIDKTKLVVTAYYDDESNEVVAAADYEVAFDNTVAAEDVTVTVTYEGKTATFKVNVVEAEEEWTASETKQTIYFTNNKGWSKVYIYAWVGEDSDKHELTTWEGKEEMTFAGQNDMSQDVYNYTLSVSYENIIITDGSEQTEDIALSGLTGDNNAYYLTDNKDGSGHYIVGQWECAPADLTQPKALDHITAVYSGGDVEIDGSIDKSKLVVTAYYDDESNEVVAAADYEVAFDNTVAAEDVTVTVTYEGKTATFKVNVVEAEEEWDGTLTVDVTAFNDWFEDDGGTAYLYVWYTDGTKNEEWCGVEMTKVSKGIYTGKIDTTKTVEGFIIARSANGTTAWNQTNNITTIPENHTYKVTEWK